MLMTYKTIVSGDNYELPLEVKDSNQVPVDLTGATVRLTCAITEQPKTKEDIVFQIEGEITEPIVGKVNFSILPQHTEWRKGDFPFDIEVTLPDGKRHTVVKGFITIIPDVTTII